MIHDIEKKVMQVLGRGRVAKQPFVLFFLGVVLVTAVAFLGGGYVFAEVLL